MSNGADVNISGSVGDTPVHLACAKGHLKVTQLLVEGNRTQKADGKLFRTFIVQFGLKNLNNLASSVFL